MKATVTNIFELSAQPDRNKPPTKLWQVTLQAEVTEQPTFNLGTVLSVDAPASTKTAPVKSAKLPKKGLFSK